MSSSTTFAEGGGAVGSSASAAGATSAASRSCPHLPLYDGDARRGTHLPPARSSRSTIATEQPHVKVAWRISRRKEEKR
jgi:hypothetical protein